MDAHVNPQKASAWTSPRSGRAALRASMAGCCSQAAKRPNRSSNSPAVLGVVRAFFRANKPVFAICHGPQILISAGVLRDLPTFLREVMKKLHSLPC
jgi:transcriptional regulator GlxA family with amidase domain